MRGADVTQVDLFSYRTLEERISPDHPLRKLRLVVDAILGSMDSELPATNPGLRSRHSKEEWHQLANEFQHSRLTRQ